MNPKLEKRPGYTTMPKSKKKPRLKSRGEIRTVDGLPVYEAGFVPRSTSPRTGC